MAKLWTRASDMAGAPSVIGVAVRSLNASWSRPHGQRSSSRQTSRWQYPACARGHETAFSPDTRSPPASARVAPRPPGRCSGCGRGGSRAGPGGAWPSPAAASGVVGDLRRAGASRHASPADPRPVEPVGDLDLPAGPAPIDHRGEGADAAVRARQPRAFAGHGAALAAAVAEVDRHQGKPRWPGDRARLGRQGAHQPRRRASRRPRSADRASRAPAGAEHSEACGRSPRRAHGRARPAVRPRAPRSPPAAAARPGSEPDMLDRRGAVFGARAHAPRLGVDHAHESRAG